MKTDDLKDRAARRWYSKQLYIGIKPEDHVSLCHFHEAAWIAGYRAAQRDARRKGKKKETKR